MNAVRRLIRDWPVATFLPLAFLLSWYPWLIALAQGRSTGPNPLGPFAAALVVSALGAGWPSVSALLASILRARVDARWYVFAVGLPIALTAASIAVNTLFGAPVPTLAQLAAWPTLADTFLVIFLFIALGEEPGWRGFLLPRLVERWGLVHGSLALSLIWAVWHLPLIGTELPRQHVAPFLIGVVAATVVLTQLWHGGRGSVLLTMLMHATVNTVGAGFVYRWVEGADLTRLWWINAVLWSIIGALAVLRMAKGTRVQARNLPSASEA